MSNRRGRDRNLNNSIRGPQSALTDFLAANNISAVQIRRDHEQRVAAAEASAAQDAAGEEPDEVDSDQARVTAALDRARKRKQDDTIKKIKAQKKHKAKLSRKGKGGSDVDDDDDDEELSRSLAYQNSKPLPGQLENCEECGKRFTVTPYSREGPSGGLLCTKCSKAQEADKKKATQNKKGRIAREKRRKLQSDLLDGVKPQGVRSLQDQCLERIAEHINDVDEFGDLPPKLLDRLSEILSKRRLITPRTLDLFLRSDIDRVSIYDCGKLENDDFIKILAFTPQLKSLTLEHAGQIKDNVIDYLLERPFPLESLRLEAANLVSDEKWREFFGKKGHQLKELKLTWLDTAMNDETVAHLVDGCPNLRYLKLKRCTRVTDASVSKIAELKHLEHLHLRFGFTDCEALCSLIAKVGSKLRSLTLDDAAIADDNLLAAIHAHCRNLTKLRITHNDRFSDKGLAAMFNNWPNVQLASLNMSSVRSVDQHRDQDGLYDGDGSDEDNMERDDQLYGVGPAAFAAIMRHSGTRLERLVLPSCRHIGHENLLDAFTDPTSGVARGRKNGNTASVLGGKSAAGRYPHLTDVDLSFVGDVDNTIVTGIFRSAPRLERLAVFGCFGVRDAIVPPGVVLIGVPNAQDPILMEG